MIKYPSTNLTRNELYQVTVMKLRIFHDLNFFLQIFQPRRGNNIEKMV